MALRNLNDGDGLDAELDLTQGVGSDRAFVRAVVSGRTHEDQLLDLTTAGEELKQAVSLGQTVALFKDSRRSGQEVRTDISRSLQVKKNIED